MTATGSSPDAFQATSCLDLCPLECSLPSSQWETANSTLKALCSTFEHLTTQLSTWQLIKSALQQHQSKSPSLFNFRGPCPTDKIKGLWDPKRTSTSPKTSWNWMRIIHNALTAVFLDPCHGVRSHGTSSSQGWRKRIAIQSTVIYSLNLFHELHPCFQTPWFMQVCVGKPSHGNRQR